MIYYELVKVLNNTSDLAKVMLNIIMKYHNILNFFVGNLGSVFIFKFKLFMYHFSSLKCYLFTYFHFKTNS